MMSLQKLAEEWKNFLLPSWTVSFPTEFNPTLEFSHRSTVKNENFHPVSLCVNENLSFTVKVKSHLVVELPEELPKQISSIDELKKCLSMIKQWRLCPGITDSRYNFDEKDLPQTKNGNLAAMKEEDPFCI
jgi:hypothetical protein